jgi:transposase
MDTLTLTGRQRRRLRQQLRSTNEARLYRRTLAVLEVADGQPVAAVASRLGVTARAVYLWLAAYARDHDPDALRDRRRAGRPTRLQQPDRDALAQLLGHSPQEFGYPATTWTVPLLRDHLARHGGPDLSDDTVRRELHRLGYSWKRPRYRLDPDPEARGKKDGHPPADPPVAGAECRPGRG